MGEQAPALTRTPPGSGTSLASCPRVSYVPQDMGSPASLEDSQHAAPERGGLSRVERQQMNVHMGGVAAVFPWQADKKKISVYDFKYYDCKCSDLWRKI